MTKKLCLVISSLGPGGMERVMSELAECFCQKQIVVHLVLYGIKPEIFYHLPVNIIIHKPSFRFNNRLRIWFTLKTFIYLRSEIKKIRPDSVLSFGEYWNNFVLLALYGFKCPVYVSDRCQPDKSLGNFHNLLRKFLYPRAAGVIVQTNIAKDIYQRMLPEAKLYVIGNPIRTIVKEPGILKENIVLSVGRLIKTKHHDELIRIFVKVNPSNWKLVIIGDDANRQQNKARLNALIKELNAEDKVLLAGTRNDVDTFYKKSKIFAFTSSSEGFPNVIGEAMSAGLPVIAFDCIAGPSELIQNKINGLLIKLFDYEEYERSLIILMKDDSLRKSMGENAQSSITRFSTKIVSETYYSVLVS